MSMHDQVYDIAVIGGGLAGLSAAILLADSGFKVILFEKEQYPFHKVCGEYISMESYDFLKRLGLPLDTMNVPLIKKLVVTSPGGTRLEADLPLGGFGISRYKTDLLLKEIAVEKKVVVLELCKVEKVAFENDQHVITTNQGSFSARTCCGSFGKRSNIDVKWKRPFITQKNDRLSNFIGIKYHIKTDHPLDTIALHNFQNGYCGISKIEDDKYCLCYLTTAQNLKESNNSIEIMEKEILSKNIFLKNLLERSEKIYEAPLSISQISFNKKSQVENHVLMLGDAAGMITPLCGNGMSMAMHSGKIAAEQLTGFLKNEQTREQMGKNYQQEWKNNFAARLRIGRLIQGFFGKSSTTNLFVKTMKALPFLTKIVIRTTHGKAF